MVKKKRAAGKSETPNAGELDALAVLWEETAGDGRPLQLSEIYRRVCERRRAFEETEPALTTVSTHLRALTRKALACEVGIDKESQPQVSASSRGAYSPPTRSPHTGYYATRAPSDVLFSTLRGLVLAYPANGRHQAVIDFARAAGISQAAIASIAKVLKISI